MTTVLLVDDESMIRAILRDYLSIDPSITVVGEAANGQAAVTQASALRPDVVLMDMQMPVMDGVEATRRIHATHPRTAIIGLTTFSSDRYVVDLLRAGASGYLVKNTFPEDLVKAVHAVMAGESVLAPEVARFVVRALESSIPQEITPDKELLERLTEKELEVIRLLARGMSNAEMAGELFITESAVKARFVKILEKLGVRDRVQILVKAAEHGLVDLRARTDF